MREARLTQQPIPWEKTHQNNWGEVILTPWFWDINYWQAHRAPKAFETEHGGCSSWWWFRHTSMNSDHIHQVQEPPSHQLTRTITGPVPCLQEAVSPSKGVPNTLMSLAKHICSREECELKGSCWSRCFSKTLFGKGIFLEEEWESKVIVSAPLKRGRLGSGGCKRSQREGRDRARRSWLWSRNYKLKNHDIIFPCVERGGIIILMAS